MTWRDDLRRVSIGGRQLIGASFRGVPFFVDTSERAGGRRAVVHEFPYNDNPYAEDLGRRGRTFRVDGYVIGNDYLAKRDALLEALEDTAGPGTLVHPYHGARVAMCLSVQVRESRTEGGIATFSIEFAETPTQVPAPTEIADPADQVSTSADTALMAIDAELAERYDPSNLPAFALASAETAIKQAATYLQQKLGPVISATQEAANLTGQIALLTASASSLARSPALILGGFRSALTALAQTAIDSPGDVMNALIDAYSVNLGSVATVATTASRARELTNYTALTSALRRVFAIEASRLAPLVPYVSIEEATAARDEIAALLDEQAALAGDTAYPALVDLRSLVLSAVPGGAAFASVVTVSRSVPIPSLLLAYQLYGSVDLEPDIIARNRIKHPGFIAGDLKVLSDG